MKDQNIIFLSINLKTFCIDNYCQEKIDGCHSWGFKALKGRVATVREKSGKRKTFQGQGEVREFFNFKEVENKAKNIDGRSVNFELSDEGSICMSCYLLLFRKLKHDSASLEFQKKNNGPFSRHEALKQFPVVCCEELK